MSLAGVATTGLSTLAQVQRSYEKLQTEFKQLGQDLSSGNLKQAQTDFAALAQLVASQESTKILNSTTQTGATTSGSQSAQRTTPISVPTSVEEQFLQNHPPNPHGISSSSTQLNSALTQMLNQLGQALQAGNLVVAQQAFAGMQQLWLENTAASGGSIFNSNGTASGAKLSISA